MSSPIIQPSASTSDLQNALNAIQPMNTLLNSSIINTICQTVQIKFNGIDLQQHTSDPNFISFMCNLIEQAFPDAKKQKINKKDILIKCFNQLQLTVDGDIVNRIVEFLHSTGQIQEVIQIVKEARPIVKKILNGFLRFVRM